MKLFKSYADFLTCLEESGFTGQVYDGRTSNTGVKSPYIVCVNESSNGMFADNHPFVKADDLTVFLLSIQDAKGKLKQRDNAKKTIEKFFNDNGIPFTREEDYLDEVELWQDQYNVTIYYEDES